VDNDTNEKIVDKSAASPLISSQELLATTAKTERNGELLEILFNSLPAIRLIGYLLLIAELVDFANLFLGMQAMNPQWEWKTFGVVAQQMPVLLIASGLILLGGRYSRGNFERRVLQPFRWSLLLLGIIYLLLLPLAGNNLFRLNQAMEQGLDRQLDTINKQTATAQQRLDQMSGNEPLLSRIDPNASEDPEASLSKLADRVTEENTLMLNKAQLGFGERQTVLLKQALTWFSYAVIAGIGLISLWRKSDWIPECRPVINDIKNAEKKYPNFIQRRIIDWQRRPVKAKRIPLHVRIMEERRRKQRAKKRGE
jgi:hypothetical protein